MDLKDVANSAKSDSNHDLVGVDCISPAAKLAKQLRCFKANKTAGLALDVGNAIIAAMSSTSDVVYAGRDSPSEFANVASASDTNKTANRTRKRRGKAILKCSSKLASVTANTAYLGEAGFNALSGCSPTEFTDVVDKPDTRSRRNRGKTGVRKKPEQSQSVVVCSKGSKHHDDSGSDSSSKNTGTPSQVEKKGVTRKRTAREKTENSAGKKVPRKVAKLSVVDSDKKKTFRKQKQSVSCNGKKQTKVTRKHSATPGTDREAAPMGEGSCLVPSAGAGASGDAPEASSESESEWEEVDELPGSNLSVRDQVPTAPVEIVLEGPLLKRGKKHQHKLDVKTYFRRLMNRYKKDTQLDMHKVHLLCLLSYGFHRNDMCNDVMLKAVALSILPARFTDIGDWDISVLGKLTGWFRDHFIVNSPLPGNTAHLVATLVSGVTQGHVSSHTELVFVFLAMLRSLGLDVRLVISLQPVPMKPIDLDMKTCSENKKKAADSGQTKNKSVKKVSKKESLLRKGCSEKISKEDAHMRTNVEIKQESDKGEETRQVGVTLSAKISRKCKLKKVKKNAEWEKEERESLDKDIQQDVTASVLVKSTGQVTKQDSGRPRRRGSKVNYAESRQEEREETEERSSTPGDRGKVEEELRLDGGKRKGTGRETREGDQSSADDDDFVEETMKVRVVSKARKPTRTKREVAASDDDDNVTLKDDDSGMNHWTEVFLPRQQCWICVDCVRARVAEPDKIERWATSPICYVLGFDNRNFVKDITSRYAYDWMHTTRKLRVSPEWWQAVLAPYCSPNMEQDRRENEELKAKFTEEPLPTVIGQYKNHPLYALKRHLLKFEAIYPLTALILGYVRGEPVYPRECVCNLHSRETWLKEGLVVKIGEEPYKMVKARPKWRKPHENTTDPTLPIFGRWQTEMYVAPPAVDGKVPVNEYGNVELFQASMLPAGTVHIRVPGLQKVAKKLNIDCPPAMVGWDFHGGFNHPVMDGWVVCVEHREILLVAWDEDQEIQRQRDIEKREARATGNWKLLVKGLLIRQRLRCRYDLQETAPGSVGKTDKRRLEHYQRPARDTALAWPQNRKQAQPNDKSQNRGPLFPFEMEHM